MNPLPYAYEILYTPHNFLDMQCKMVNAEKSEILWNFFLFLPKLPTYNVTYLSIAVGYILKCFYSHWSNFQTFHEIKKKTIELDEEKNILIKLTTLSQTKLGRFDNGLAYRH